MNEFSTLLLDQPVFTQPAFSQNGRKGVSYDWQSLLDAETLIALDRDLDLELAITCTE